MAYQFSFSHILDFKISVFQQKEKDFKISDYRAH